MARLPSIGSDGQWMVSHDRQGERSGYLHQGSEASGCQDCAAEAALPEDERPVNLIASLVADVMRAVPRTER